MSAKNFKSALKVQDGIEQPASFNEEAVKKHIRNKPSIVSNTELLAGIRAGNTTLLSKAITLVESKLPQHQTQAQDLICQCLPYAGNSIRVGITGVPGAGKSSFIEVLGKLITNQQKKIAVLAIDPSSYFSKGSILGDKTRMEELSADSNAFIRPSPAAGTLGGVAQKTWESIILCEAAGFDIVFVETVGVGQSETLVHSMVDFFLLVMLAGAGDELQGIKRGIMEMADTIVINKADGNNIEKARIAQADYQNALHLFPPTESGWVPRVQLCSAHQKTGIKEVWETIENYVAFAKQHQYFDRKRSLQEIQRMQQATNDLLLEHFYQQADIVTAIEKSKEKILLKKITSYNAAIELNQLYLQILKKK